MPQHPVAERPPGVDERLPRLAADDAVGREPPGPLEPPDGLPRAVAERAVVGEVLAERPCEAALHVTDVLAEVTPSDAAPGVGLPGVGLPGVTPSGVAPPHCAGRRGAGRRGAGQGSAGRGRARRGALGTVATAHATAECDMHPPRSVPGCPVDPSIPGAGGGAHRADPGPVGRVPGQPDGSSGEEGLDLGE